MYIYGSFISQRGDTVTVHIVTGNDRTQTLEIGTEKADVYFTDDPAEITNEVNDTFDHLLRQSAKINLLCGSLMSDLFCTSCRDAVVNIYKSGKCVFAGFVEPQTFSQPYNDRWDEIALNCIDVLSALQYSNYKNIGALGVDYDVVKNEAKQRSFYDIVAEILNGATERLDIIGGQSCKFWFDGSKAIDAQIANRYQIFNQLSINELLFLGDDESDVWQQDTILEEMLKYLNLHITQDGLDFYIFAWESIKASPDKIIWHDLEQNTAKQIAQDSVTISLDNVADSDTTININDVYNQLQLTANTKEMEDIIESPLDDDLLTSPYIHKQEYVTEYSSDGEGVTAYRAFNNMVFDQATTYGEGFIRDWYIQIQQNKQWLFPKNGDTSVDLIDYFCKDGKNQHDLPDWLGQNPGACLMSIGNVKTNTAHNDNSPTSKVNMTNYFVVSVNGNGHDEEDKTYPSSEDIRNNIPYAVYKGNSAGGVFSPADDDTKNYIVFSGKVVLNPIMDQSGEYTKLRKDPSYWLKTKNVPSRTNEDGRFYTRKYWKAEKPSDDPTWHEGADNGFYPFTDDGPQEYEFKYSAIGNTSDTVSKVAVLACMLVIGNKCVVETGTKGQTSDFEWVEYKERSECKNDDEYYQQSFTIGFDPKIGDKLVGTEFDIQNNISYTMNIDAEGIAIPIKRSDAVSGQVKFTILGPVNALWGDITRRHPTFFRHTEWTTNSIPLMAHVSSIMIQSFEVKVYSDNGMISNGDDDNDIVYLSDTKQTFVNIKDDLEFDINSALTTAECQKLGVSNILKLSTPKNVLTDEGVLEIYDRNGNVKAKPEQIYVDSYYKEYHDPRIVMEQKLIDTDDVSLFNHYHHEALGKDFFVQGIGRNLIEGRADLTLKEINDD